MRAYSKKDVLLLGMKDQTVRSHVDAFTYSQGITWGEMLHSLVVCLVEDKAALSAVLAECTSKKIRRTHVYSPLL